ncbi:MAG: hypothetical protein HY321_04345 [Armatimonadetes bacterium]|nr:hypothetical protein [Armatimonadota bacterium]
MTIALLDACALYPPALRDLRFRQAVADIITRQGVLHITKDTGLFIAVNCSA